jgi:hypothetical protein
MSTIQEDIIDFVFNTKTTNKDCLIDKIREKLSPECYNFVVRFNNGYFDFNLFMKYVAVQVCIMIIIYSICCSCRYYIRKKNKTNNQ